MSPSRAIVPFRRWHLAWLIGDGKAMGGVVMDTSTLMSLETQNSWTAVVDGGPVACGGTIQQWPGRHTAWAYLPARSGPHMRMITLAAGKTLAKPQGRIEITVRSDFAAGHRWAQMLGLEREALFRAYGPEGEDHVGYVRFNKG